MRRRLRLNLRSFRLCFLHYGRFCTSLRLFLPHWSFSWTLLHVVHCVSTFLCLCGSPALDLESGIVMGWRSFFESCRLKIGTEGDKMRAEPLMMIIITGDTIHTHNMHIQSGGFLETCVLCCIFIFVDVCLHVWNHLIHVLIQDWCSLWWCYLHPMLHC